VVVVVVVEDRARTRKGRPWVGREGGREGVSLCLQEEEEEQQQEQQQEEGEGQQQ